MHLPEVFEQVLSAHACTPGHFISLSQASFPRASTA
jgi:hypothetical protein